MTMSIYVGELFATLKSKQWPYEKAAHLFADSDEELHVFAASIGLKRSWFQDHNRLHHYDVTKNKRLDAIKLGAFTLSFQEEVTFYKKKGGM